MHLFLVFHVKFSLQYLTNFTIAKKFHVYKIIYYITVFSPFPEVFTWTMIFRTDTVVLILCCGGCFYSVFYCLEKYLEDQSMTNAA